MRGVEKNIRIFIILSNVLMYTCFITVQVMNRPVMKRPVMNRPRISMLRHK